MLAAQQLFLLVATTAVAAEDRAPVFLFVDPQAAPGDRAGWEPVVPAAQKEPSNPLMEERQIWEVRWDNTYATTRWDEDMKKFRMWYGSTLSCDRVPKPSDAHPNPIDGCGHPTWHQQYPDQVPRQTASGLSGILYAESKDGLTWTKPALDLIPWGDEPGEGCSRIGRGLCVKDRPFPPCLNGSLGGGDLFRANLTLPQAVARCHESARCAGFSAMSPDCPGNGTLLDVHFKDAYGAKRLSSSAGWHSWQTAAKGGATPLVNGTNIIAMHTGGDGILYDARDRNASRRYKLFGGIDWHMCSDRPASNVAADGTAWPPCHLTGADYSADGIHFEHGYNESTIPSDQFYDIIGQNDGTLDVAVYDDALGYWWGLVRIDAGFVGRPGIANANPRRTGRFTTPDMRSNFTAAVQVFNGTADYQIYMVLPFRLPSWRPGYYMATASFLLLNQTVRTELLHSVDHGLHWEQVAAGTEFIPLGSPGQFDSFTTYTSWSGTAEPLLDPKDPNRTLFYYSGGDGQHDGQRDDSIGLAYATTHGYAGIRSTGTGREAAADRTSVIRTANLSTWQTVAARSSADVAASVPVRWEVLASIGSSSGSAGGTSVSSSSSSSALRVRLVSLSRAETVVAFDRIDLSDELRETPPPSTATATATSSSTTSPPHWGQFELPQAAIGMATAEGLEDFAWCETQQPLPSPFPSCVFVFAFLCVSCMANAIMIFSRQGKVQIKWLQLIFFFCGSQGI
jgi:hypothetical protein